MHWQDACLKSKINKAIRENNIGLDVIIDQFGGGIIQCKKHSGEFRQTYKHELMGHTDWEPLIEKEVKR